MYQVQDGLRLGPVELTVADLDRSIGHYTGLIGAEVVSVRPEQVELGVGDRAFVVLRRDAGVGPAAAGGAGLSHVAVDVPTDADVARLAHHLAHHHRTFQLVDHAVSVSCYVADDDGHTLEVTHPQPESAWRWQDGFPVLLRTAIDPDALLERAGAGAAVGFTGLPATPAIGHVQLQATDRGLVDTERFYCDVLGFAVRSRLGRGFLGVGIAPHRSLLVFTDRFGGPAGDADRMGSGGRRAALTAVNVRLPDTDAVDAVAARLRNAGHRHERDGAALIVTDPSGNPLRFSAAS